MMNDFQSLQTMAQKKEPQCIAVAQAGDKEVLLAIQAAQQKGIIKPILVGNKDEILRIAAEIGYSLTNAPIIHADSAQEACVLAVKEITEKRATILMKGLVDTSVILKAVLNKDAQLRTGRVLSHVACFQLPKYHKLLFVTDAAMNIAPSIEEKKQITENAVHLLHSLGVSVPKVAVLCAKEKVNEKMPATVEAQSLVDMNEKGEIKDCIVGGPFALDNAVSKEAAHHKGIHHPVAGDADILLVPDIEAGNILYKALAFLAESENAGVIVGAKIPIVLTSRADSDEAKYNSIALAVVMAAASN